MARSRLYLFCLALLATAIPGRHLAAADAPELVVIEDFETGTSRWYAVQGEIPEGVKAFVTLTPTVEAKRGEGAGRLRFAAGPNTWGHVQMGIVPAEWTAIGPDRVRLWVKGDGSGEALNLMFGNYERKPPLSFRYRIPLDFTGWRQVTIPLRGFVPEGLPGALREMVLIQLNASGTTRPIDILVDEIELLPAERTEPAGTRQDLDLLARGGWDTPAPEGAVPVDPFAGVPEGTVLPRYLHGVRNHRALHNPVEFAVEYAEPGSFAVQVGNTSGWGGSRLIILIDGKEALRRDFPGETQAAIKSNQGWYSVPVPAGKHRIRVDNDGADWCMIESYRFGNYAGVEARVRREDGALVVRFSRPEEAAGITIEARVAGWPLPLQAEAPGMLVARPPSGFPTGIYPVRVTGRRGEKLLFTRDAKMRLRAPRVRVVRVAFPTGEPVEFRVSYCNSADVPVPGYRLRVRVGERALALEDLGDGLYGASLGRLPAGIYTARVWVDGAGLFPVKFVVYDPAARPWEREGIIRLDARGQFRTKEGRPFIPWGFATNGIYLPDPEVIQRPPGPTGWCRADEDAIREWIALLRAYGVNCVRFGVNVGTASLGGDQGGHADPFILEGLRRYLDMIGPLGVRAIPVMWWGHYRNFGFQGIPAYDALIKEQADWFTNPRALELQKQYVREVVAAFKDDPRILAWEVMNETYRAGGDLQASVRWTNAILDTIREVDPNHLTTTSAAEATPGPQIEWMRGTPRLDFFNWHAYPTYPDYHSWQSTAGQDAPREIGVYAATVALAQRLGGKPSILGETGNDRQREVSYPEYRALVTRDCLWLAFLCGSPGGIAWDAIADPREFEVISHLAGQIDWTTFREAPAPVAVRVSDPVKELGALARYSAWSLRTGVPIRFLGAGEAPAPGQVAVTCPFAEPKVPASTAPLRASPGYECKVLASEDGRVLLGYARNAGEMLPQNARTRVPRDLRLTLELRRPATVEIWDLDTRECVWQGQGRSRVEWTQKRTDHDYAVLARSCSWKGGARASPFQEQLD